MRSWRGRPSPAPQKDALDERGAGAPREAPADREEPQERDQAVAQEVERVGTTGQAPPRPCAMADPETKVADLCRELGVTRQTLYRHVTPQGALRPDGERLLTHHQWSVQRTR